MQIGLKWDDMPITFSLILSGAPAVLFNQHIDTEQVQVSYFGENA